MAPMILVDDVTGNGMTDLVVTTGFRFLYCLSTDTPYHPLNTWYEYLLLLIDILFLFF